jgi:hypothetical protein
MQHLPWSKRNKMLILFHGFVLLSALGAIPILFQEESDLARHYFLCQTLSFLELGALLLKILAITLLFYVRQSQVSALFLVCFAGEPRESSWCCGRLVRVRRDSLPEIVCANGKFFSALQLLSPFSLFMRKTRHAKEFCSRMSRDFEFSLEISSGGADPTRNLTTTSCGAVTPLLGIVLLKLKLIHWSLFHSWKAEKRNKCRECDSPTCSRTPHGRRLHHRVDSDVQQSRRFFNFFQADRIRRCTFLISSH